MKKLLTHTGAALLLLAALIVGCGQEEQIETLDNQLGTPTTFSAVVGKQTESPSQLAKEFGYWQPGETLDVTSYMTGAGSASPIPFHLTYEGPNTTSWTYSPLIDVPNPPFSRTYYAYYPTTANVSNMQADGMDGSFSYTVRESALQEDLVAAKTVTAYARVALMFHHLLSQVNFAVQGKQGVHINISNIKLNGIANSSTYTFSPSGGSWAAPTGTAEYPYTPINPAVFPTDGSNNNIIYLGNKGGSVATDNNNNNALMIMPQSFEPATGGNITFEYNLTDMTNQPMKSGNVRVYLGDFTTKKWEMGKRYLYLLDLTGLIEEGPITFEVIVFGWSDAMQNVAQPVVVSEGNQLLIEKAISFQNTEKATTPSLTVFPISLVNAPMPGSPNDKITLSNFSWDSFAPGDQVRIWCFNYSNAMRIQLDQTNSALINAWTIVYPADPGTPDKDVEVVLIKK